MRSSDKEKIGRASVIPVMVHPTAGVYVLLARSRAGEWDGASKWGDFGGSSQEGEEPEDTAAREVAEESVETLVKWHERHIFRQSLLDKQYVLKHESQFNTTYIVRFAWDPSKVYEFSLMRKVLAGLQKLARGLELGRADRETLCKYRWFCRDTRLTRILQHPAVHSRAAPLPPSEIAAAQHRLATALGLRSVTPSRADKAIVVTSVDSAWLEKDKLQLFSLEQVRAMLCGGGSYCRGAACSELDDAVKPALRLLSRVMRFYGCQGQGEDVPQCSPEAEAEVSPT